MAPPVPAVLKPRPPPALIRCQIGCRDATGRDITQTAVSANKTIHGTSVNDIVYGYDYGGSVPTNGTIALFGLDGTNYLYAGSGTTALYGGPDTNTLVGGASDDSFYVYSNQTTVTDAYTTGNNTLYASGVNATLPENVDTLYLYGSGLTGTGNDQDDTDLRRWRLFEHSDRRLGQRLYCWWQWR